MKLILKSISIAFITTFLLLSNAFAQSDENTTLHLYFTNNTDKVLKFDHIAVQMPGNEFSVNPSVINPGEATVITAETLANNDIDARLIFVSPDGDEAILSILDQLQIHYGQPVFNVTGNTFKSTLVSKTRNKNVGPRYLTYLVANLQVVNK